MHQSGSLPFSKRTIFIWSLAAILLTGAMVAIFLQSPAVQAGEGDADDGQQGTGGRLAMTDASYEKFARADDVTRVIRDRRQAAYWLPVDSLEDRANAARIGTIVEDYGKFVIVSSGKKLDLPADGSRGRKLETAITLPGKTFEPLSAAGAERAAAAKTAKTGSEKGYYIVQFAGAMRDEWMESLRSQGIEFLQYVPHNAYYVYADGEQIRKAAAHSRVRWTGGFDAGDKITPVLERQIAAAKSGTELRGTAGLESAKAGTAVFDIAVFSRADIDEVTTALQTGYGAGIKSVSVLPNSYMNMIRAELPLDTAIAAANIPHVITIDGAGTPQAEDERAAQIVAGNYTGTTVINGPGYNPLAQFGVDGANVTVSVGDDGISIPGNGGFYLTSTNTVNGPLRGATAGASGGHGHLNASIIAGDAPFGALDPAGYNYALGVAPKSNIINIPFLKSGNTTTDAQLANDTVTTAGPNGVNGTISNNSWGNGTNLNVYDAYTATYDGFVRDASTAGTVDPLVLVFSAGNCGNSPNNTACSSQSGLTRPKVAKNIISVASSENLRTELGGGSANNMGDMSSFSSLGLAGDGRVKPDIAAPGDVITGSRAGANCSSVSSCFEANHSWSSGTSHAAPQIAGVAALFTQYWKASHSNVNPSPAMVKAAILQTGQDMAGANAAAAVPNGREGWGRVNMKYMLNTGAPMLYSDQETVFSDTGSAAGFTGTVADASKPVRVTLVWTDPPGAANANPALVNNLDLTVTVGGNTYKGNVFTAGSSTTGGAADTLNNVEHVWLPAGIPAGTPFSIQINATAINGDGVLGNGDATDQNFALVAYNYQTNTVPPSDVQSDFDGDGKTDIAVWRPSNGAWYVLRSSDSVLSINVFGAQGDRIAPGDYDGDGKTDMAVFRPSTGVWYVQRSTAGLMAQAFGQNGDVPVQGDYDGDNKYDIAVWRWSTGVWYLQQSSAGFGGTSFGANGDKPVQGDYDGDGKTDIAVFRTSNGAWYVLGSSAGLTVNIFGLGNDQPVQGDYDGDGKYDLAIWRPSDGNWYIQRSTAGLTAFNFGTNSDNPVPGDYDGDGKDDAGVYRGPDGGWYLLRSQAGFSATTFGAGGDIPVPMGYIPQ